MTHIIIQPAASKEAQAHLHSTIYTPVPLQDIRPYLRNDQFTLLSKLYPENAAPIWGATPGSRLQRVPRWDHITPGDIGLFAAKKRFFLSGMVTYKVRSSSLARYLWGVHPDGEDFELIYFLNDLRQIDVPYTQFNAVLGYSPNAGAREFRVLDEEKGELYVTQIERQRGFEQRFEAAVQALDQQAPLEREVTATVRQEQTFLRSRLLAGNAYARCGICGRFLPAELLIAAHIKQRANCTDTEKRNIPNVGMLVCSLGCEALFKDGYVTVVDGTAQMRPSPGDVPDLTKVLQELDGRKCIYWTEDRTPFFEWHATNRAR